MAEIIRVIHELEGALPSHPDTRSVHLGGVMGCREIEGTGAAVWDQSHGAYWLPFCRWFEKKKHSFEADEIKMISVKGAF